MVTKRSSGKKSITLRDVVSHIQGVKSELSTDMKHMEQRLTKRIDDVNYGLSKKIDEVESSLTERINDLDKDIMAAMSDTIDIKRHVGMHVPDEG